MDKQCVQELNLLCYRHVPVLTTYPTIAKQITIQKVATGLAYFSLTERHACIIPLTVSDTSYTPAHELHNTKHYYYYSGKLLMGWDIASCPGSN